MFLGDFVNKKMFPDVCLSIIIIAIIMIIIINTVRITTNEWNETIKERGREESENQKIVKTG